MLALDLFCGAGGASRGIANCGYEVIGVDNKYQPNYPYDFYIADAVDFLETLLEAANFNFIWASPPCQAYSWASKKHVNLGKKYVDLIEITRHYLQKSGVPYIIENVVGAPLIDPVMLCGTMFPELKVFRHRLFESNIDLKVEMKCNHKGHKAMETRDDGGDFLIVAGHFVGTKLEKGEAMGIDWMTSKEMCQAVPPVYSEYLVRQVK